MSLHEETIRVRGMHCHSCESTIETAVRRVPGVHSVKADHVSGMATVRYDRDKCTSESIKKAIGNAGYDVKSVGFSQALGVLVVVGVVALLGRNGGIDITSKLDAGATALVLFTVGALTSLHCAGMCGGILLSQTLSGNTANRRQALRPAILYNLGRVISYTALGGVVGALGSVFAITPFMKAAVMLLAGLFMVITGANMAGFRVLSKIAARLRLPGSLHGQHFGGKSSNPLVVGLLNGLMPCGPLQTMQLYALGTGSFVKGASAMFVFALGTVPVMLLLGALSTLLSRGFTQRVARFSGALVVGLGIVMFGRGLTLAGYGIPVPSFLSGNRAAASGQVAKAVLENGVQTVTTVADSRGYLPNLLYVQRGVPVRWVIKGEQINSCNGEIIAPSLNISKRLRSGENVIEFTPNQDDIRFSCWMGMISGRIRVVDDLAAVDISNPDVSPPAASGGSCCAVDGAPPRESIYGDDITIVPTERLVSKASIQGGVQQASFKGTGWELEPLIVIVQSDLKVDLTLDVAGLDNPDGTYQLFSAENGKEVATFSGSKGVVRTELALTEPGAYAIVKDNAIIGLIESVVDLVAADMQAVREQYIVQK